MRRCSSAAQAASLMPLVLPGIAQSALIVGLTPRSWGPLWGRRPRRPARALHDTDIVVPTAGPGGPARTRGSAPPGCPHRADYFLGAPGAAPRPGLPVGEVQPAGGLYSARVLVLPAAGKSAGTFCVTLPVAAHSVPRW